MFWKLAERMKGNLRNQGGFTLVELIVVVVILAILAAIMIPKVQPYVQESRVTQALSDMATMKTIIESYAANKGLGYYPTAGDPTKVGDGGASNPTNLTQLGYGADIAKVLQAGGVYWTNDSTGIKDPWGNPYTYTPCKDLNNNIISWKITSPGPDKTSGDGDDIYVSNKYSPQQGTLPADIVDGTASTTVETSFK